MEIFPAGALRLTAGRAVLEAFKLEEKSTLPVLLVTVVLPATQVAPLKETSPKAVTAIVPGPLVPVPTAPWNVTFPAGAERLNALPPLVTSFRVEANKMLPLPLVTLVLPPINTAPLREIA